MLKKTIIDFTNISSYPSCIFEFVSLILNDGITLKELKGLESYIDDKVDFQKRFHPYYEKYYKEIKLLERKLSDYCIICYHATKVENLNTIRENGIFINRDEYINMLSSFLKKKIESQELFEKSVKKLKEQYDSKYEESDYHICFVLNKSAFNNGYDLYLNNIGGEIARWAFQEDLNDIFNKLCENGIPCIIKFKISFKDIVPCYQIDIVERMITNVLQNELFNRSFRILAEGKTKKKINSNAIVDIIEYIN